MIIISILNLIQLSDLFTYPIKIIILNKNLMQLLDLTYMYHSIWLYCINLSFIYLFIYFFFYFCSLFESCNN